MFPFDVILFDVGGVLLTNGWDRHERAGATAFFGLNSEAFEERHRSAYNAWESGCSTAKEYLDATVFYEPRSFSREDFFAFILAQSRPLPDSALGILGEISASKKCMVGALNNEARETNEYRFSSFGLRSHFSVAFSSCYLGLRKPEAAIYQRALDILGRPPERVLFIDDRQENTEAAIGAGMRAIHYTGTRDLRRTLEELNVLSPKP